MVTITSSEPAARFAAAIVEYVADVVSLKWAETALSREMKEGSGELGRAAIRALESEGFPLNCDVMVPQRPRYGEPQADRRYRFVNVRVKVDGPGGWAGNTEPRVDVRVRIHAVTRKGDLSEGNGAETDVTVAEFLTYERAS